MTYDVAVIGGGMVGASLGVALAPLGLRVAIVEAVPFDSARQPSFDERTTALSNGSRRILESLGVWAEVRNGATAISKIHVSEKGRFGFARIDASEQGLDAMGYVLPNRVLGRALWSRLGTMHPSELRVICPARVVRVIAGPDSVKLMVDSAGAALELDARLVVAADGVDSAVRDALGVPAESRDYRQSAVITTVLPKHFHDHIAYERFTEDGPLAILPLEDGRCTLVLTLDRDAVASAMAWSDQEFLEQLQRRFGFRLGRFLKVGGRAVYPLALSRAERTSAERCAIIGNAAQALHPVAGMGFNLGLRDVACLSELIAERSAMTPFDCGARQLLDEYDAWRAADRRGVIAFTDGLIRLFSNPLRSVRAVRNLGLLAFDVLPPAKDALSRLSSGVTGRVPKLARGMSLSRNETSVSRAGS